MLKMTVNHYEIVANRVDGSITQLAVAATFNTAKDRAAVLKKEGSDEKGIYFSIRIRRMV